MARSALAVLGQYRMATTEQLHLLTAPQMRIEQTRRRPMKLRGEGLVDRVTLAQAGRTRVWFATGYGARRPPGRSYATSPRGGMPVTGRRCG
ncbi:hypothetical protein [Streptomyces sp. NPDC017991]|uniref:hypothetical protein n=1 Tax=Streptomyces sp. NPDC017991 TaxID=3365026 RepID=UPI0037AE9F96